MAHAKRIVLLATVVGLPLIFFGSHRDEPFNVTKLCLLLAGVACAGALHALEWRAGHRTRGLGATLLPALALFIPLAISWAASPYREWSSFGQFSRFNGLIPYLLFALLGLLLTDAFWDRAAALAHALGATGAIVGAYAFVQAVGLDPFWQPGTDSGSPFPPSSIGHFNFAGGFLAICLPLAIHAWAKGERSWPGMTMTILIALGLMMTNSQGAWLAALTGVLIVAGGSLASRWPRARVASLGAVGALVIALIVGVVLSADSDQPQLGATAKTRGLLWASAVEMGADSPLVGRGPAAFAVEGVRYRPLEYILVERNTVADDPHSVPLSFWANGGALGALGFLLFAGWIVQRGFRMGTGNHLGTAYFAGAIAYLVQSLVTVDELSLRSGLWVAVAGLAITSSRRNAETENAPSRPGGGSRWAAAAVALGLAVSCILYSAGLMRAHRDVVGAEERFSRGDVEGGEDLFERATRFRFEPRYLAQYATRLGATGLGMGEQGGPFIDHMLVVNDYLDEFPSTIGLLGEARMLFYWGHFEPSAFDLAEATLLEVEPLDPENPEVEIRLAEIRLARGDARGAIDLLAPISETPAAGLPGVWATLSLAHAAAGDTDAGRADLDRALSLGPNDCRVLTARALYEYLDEGRTSSRLASSIGINCGAGIARFREDLIEAHDL